MTTKLAFEQVQVRDFRNLRELVLTLSPRINVVSGDNGQGKTSLLEALYFVATSKSFRADRTREMLREGAEAGLVRAQIIEDGRRREQRATLTASARAVLLEGKKPERLSSYATRTPVVVFHPGDLSILTGGASERRTLLDRIALFLDPSSADSRQRYTRASRARQVALEQRGTGAMDLEPLEQLMSTDGTALARARTEAARRLVDALGPLFSRMGAPGLVLEARFASGGSLDAAEMRVELKRRREQD
ncbi:MAG TPA: AAA family ATPase, partial [Polyangiaceae bacterium]